MNNTFTSIKTILQLFLSSSGITTDSRNINAGNIFIALKGDKFDGHKFAAQALQSGAKYAIVSDASLVKNEKYILVEDTLVALQQLAKLYRSTVIKDIPLVVIAGSNGKTTTKELMFAVIARKYNTYCTPENFNNHIGVPLSILSIGQQHERAIIEIGANHLGEHTLLCQIAQPHIVVITNCGKDHLEGYGDEQGVILSTQEVINYMYEHNRQLILNGDDLTLCEVDKGNAIFYGLDNRNNHLRSRYIASGSIINEFPFLEIEIEGFTCQTQLFGAFQLQNVLATLALSKLWDVPTMLFKAAIESYVPNANRTQLIEWQEHKVLLDAYNANPSSMLAMLDSFTRYDVPNKIIILGEMAELGTYSKKEHLALFKSIDQTVFTYIILVGAAFANCEKDDKAKVVHFVTTSDLEKWLHKQKLPPSFFMVKGSRFLALEKLFL